MTIVASGDDSVGRPRKARDAEYYKKQNEVVDDFLKGNSNYTQLAKYHSITRAEVIEMIDEVKEIWRNDKSFKEMGRERLQAMDRHYDMILSKLWEAHDNLVDDAKHDKAAASLKMISEVEAKRQDALQKAGMYDDSELADLMMETERKTTEIAKFLMELVKQEPHLKEQIVTALRKIEDPNYLPDPIVLKKGERWDSTVNTTIEDV